MSYQVARVSRGSINQNNNSKWQHPLKGSIPVGGRAEGKERGSAGERGTSTSHATNKTNEYHTRSFIRRPEGTCEQSIVLPEIIHSGNEHSSRTASSRPGLAVDQTLEIRGAGGAKTQFIGRVRCETPKWAAKLPSPA